MNTSGLYIISIETTDLVSRFDSAKVKRIFSDLKFETVGHITIVPFERMSIEEGRSMRSSLSSHVYGGTTVLLVDRFPFDAQQTLLKVLEELPQGMVLYIFVSNDVMFLKTVLSRTLKQFEYIDSDSSQEEITQATLEKLHKKDPELHKKTVSFLGHEILNSLLQTKKLKSSTKLSLYKQVLQLIENLQTARSAKIIADFFLNVQNYLQKI